MVTARNYSNQPGISLRLKRSWLTICAKTRGYNDLGFVVFEAMLFECWAASEGEETSGATAMVVFDMNFSSVSSVRESSFSSLIKLSNAMILQSLASISACESASFLFKVDMFSKKVRLSSYMATESC
jgi:hypothetical protein